MTNFLSMAATMQTLSIAGIEEASREGRREGDIEHVLLALILNEQAAGRALRSLGITLDAARAAVRAQHQEQLRQIGVSIEQERPDRIVFHETDGYEWTERALMIMSRSSEGAGRGDAASVLRRLLDEPSGLIGEILERLDTTADAVRAALADAEQAPPRAASADSPTRGWVRGRFETFVPASIDDVWALVSNVERMPEWEQMTGSVVPDAADETSWIAVAPSHHPDGKPLKVKEGYRRRRVIRTEAISPGRVVWQFAYPDAPALSSRSLTVELAAINGGTRVALASAWRRRTGWRLLVGLAVRPVQRYFVWLMLSQAGGAISRAFR